METNSEPTNQDRADWARQSLDTFCKLTGIEMEPIETQVADLLTDRMHLCAREVDFSEVLRIADMHYGAETAEEL